MGRSKRKTQAFLFLLLVSCFFIGCGSKASVAPETPIPNDTAAASRQDESVSKAFAAEPSPELPNLQSELTTREIPPDTPLGHFDFANFTYPLPRGWQHRDGDEITLTDGKLEPKMKDVSDDMSPDEKAAAKAERRIGASLVNIKYLDVDGDGAKEAVVILKIETGGSAIPQLVYIYKWKDEKPELLWNFRTGDRADGGLKSIRAENGELIVELFGRDRFLLGQTETGKITGDEEQLCCPTHFTRTRYKYNGRNFLMQGKRLTYSIADHSAPPEENLGEKVNAATKSKK